MNCNKYMPREEAAYRLAGLPSEWPELEPHECTCSDGLRSASTGKGQEGSSAELEGEEGCSGQRGGHLAKAQQWEGGRGFRIFSITRGSRFPGTVGMPVLQVVKVRSRMAFPPELSAGLTLLADPEPKGGQGCRQVLECARGWVIHTMGGAGVEPDRPGRPSGFASIRP